MLPLIVIPMTQQPILPHYKSPYTEFMKEESILHANENAKQDAHGNILHRPNIIKEKLYEKMRVHPYLFNPIPPGVSK